MTLIIILYALFWFFFFGLVLMQKDKSGGMITPGEASQSLFGSQGQVVSSLD